MSIVLYRVDERLIHGQVIVGWAQLKPQRIVVVDDVLADSVWEQELYTLGLPADLISEFCTVVEARDCLDGWRKDTTRTLLLTRDIATMRKLAQGGVMKGDEVNIGGIHHAPGRRPVLPYVYLSDEEQAQLRSLASDGVVVSARDVPNGKRIEASQLIPVERRA